MKQLESTHKGRITTPIMREEASFVDRKGYSQAASPVLEPSFIPPVIQPKLTISQPGDIFEEEADAAADRVMGMAAASTAALPSDYTDEDGTETGPSIMPKCASCEQEDEEQHTSVQAKLSAGAPQLMRKCSQCEAEEREHGHLQRKVGNGDAASNGFNLKSYLDRSSVAGEPIDRQTRSFMESRFSADFSSVRIHTGAAAQQASGAIQARAFTHGQHIHFNAGEFQPQTDGGRWLLAHELTHTLQQRTGAVGRVMRKIKPDEPAFYETIMGGKNAYAQAKAANLESWYYGYKFYNLFQEEEIYPGSQPNAYTTRVYELQEKLHEQFKSQYPKENITGVLEPNFANSPTLNALLGLAAGYAVDSSKDFGLNTEMLKRLNRLNTSFDKKAPPLTSQLFMGFTQLNLVNASPSFFVEKGDRGEFVARIQLALLQLNYSLGSDFAIPKGKPENGKVITGIYGEDTKKAVQQFQIDSGMEGKEVDGVVGQITLRLLDKRLEKYLRSTASYADASHISVRVPVTEDDIPGPTNKRTEEEIRKDLLIRSIMATMPLSKAEAENLIAANWHWISFKPITRADVIRGYVTNSTSKASYEQLVGKRKGSTGGISAEALSEQIIDQALALQTTNDLYRLQNEVKALEKERDGIQLMISMSERPIPSSWYDQLRSANERLKAKTEARDRELNRLGYKNIDEYIGKKEEFVKTFLQYAAMIAFQMLARNEIKASVEYQHYENLDEVTKLKEVIAPLNQYYTNSETYFMQGVSYAETDGKDINKYKTRFDYAFANQTCTENGCDTTMAEARLKALWEENIKEKSSKNPYYAKFFDEEATAFKYLKDKSENFPILGNPKFNIRENGSDYVKKTNESLRNEVREIIGTRTSDDGVLHNIAATRERIRGDVELLWEMPPVIAQAKAELGILDGTVLDTIITDAYKAHKDQGFWKTIVKAALGIGLGLLALVSGPIGWIALGASIAYGAYDAYLTYQEIKMKREASETAIDEEAMALMHEKPSYFWFVVSLVGVGLDAFQAVKVVKAVKEGIELAKGVQAAIDAEIAAAKLEKEAVKAGTKEAVTLGRRIERLEKALADIDWVHYAEHSQILKVLKDSPFAIRFMADALKEPGIAKAFTKLAKLGLSEELMKTVVGMYAGVGKKALGELPEVMRLIENGKLAGNPALLKTVLTDPKVQKVLLDSGDPAKLALLFADWEAKSAGKAVSFADYLKAAKLDTFFQKGIVLTERFGAEFAQMSNLMKNKLILREVEPLLVDALNAKRLPPSVQRSLELSLQRDVLGLTNDLGIAKERMFKELTALGGTLQFQSDYLAVMSILQNARSRTLLWEAALQLPGRGDYLKMIEELAQTNTKVKAVMSDLIRIGPVTDKATLETLIANDVLRKALAENPLAVLALKKCASPCFPPAATTDQITRLTKLLSGKSADEIAKVNNLIYQNRSTVKTLEAAIVKLENNFDDALKTVKGVDVVFPKGLTVTDSLKSAANAVVSLGMPSAQVNAIIKNMAAIGAPASRVENLMTDLIKVLELDNKVKMKNLNVLLNGLESSDKSLFKTAEFLVDEVARHTRPSDAEKAFFTYPGLPKADSLISTFGMDGLRDLIQVNRNQTGFVNNLYVVTQKVSGTKAQWVELINKAGSGGKADLEKLVQILESQTGQLTYQQAAEAIVRSKSFASDVAAAMADPNLGYQKMAKRVWGITDDVASGGVIEVPEKFKKGASGSGSAAYAQVIKEGRGIDLANTVVVGGKVDYSRWKVLKSVVENSTIAQPIKNSIIGELWTIVHGRYLEANGYKIYREVRLTDGVTIAKADIVAIKDNKLIVVEMKSMAGELTGNQSVIYPLLQDPQKIKTLSFFENAEVDAFFALNRNNTTYQMFEEAVLVPK